MATSKIIGHSVEYITDLVMFSDYDITSQVNEYSALIIEGWCNARAGVSSITIPTHFIKGAIPQNSTVRFDMGGYATVSAYLGVSFSIKRNGNNNYYINPNWAATEAGSGDVHLQMYGLK